MMLLQPSCTSSPLPPTAITLSNQLCAPPAAGTIGHVAHGKSTVVKAISGVQTVRFKNELERNITIKLGYANAKIYKCVRGAGWGSGFAGLKQRLQVWPRGHVASWAVE